MSDFDTGLDIITAPTPNDSYVAFTEKSPFLCVEAETEEEASAIAERALAFYRSTDGVPTRPAEPMRISPLVVSKRRTSKALAAA